MDPSTWMPIAKVYSPLMAGSIDGTDTEPHDNGIIRAMSAKYKPDKAVIGDPEKTVFAARLPTSLDEEGLISAFSGFGEIKRARLVRDIVTGHSRCYGFIEYVDSKSAYRAQRDGNKMIVDEKEIFVDYECERTLKGWIPRRLGGGFGGKKESGQLRFGGKDRPFRKPFIVDHSSRPAGDTFRERLEVMEGGRRRFGRDQDRDGSGFRDRGDRYSRGDSQGGRSLDRQDDYREGSSRGSDRDKHGQDERDISRSDRSSRRRSRERPRSRERKDRRRERERSDSSARRSDKDSGTTSDRYAEDFLQRIANEVKVSNNSSEPERKKRHFKEFV